MLGHDQDIGPIPENVVAIACEGRVSRNDYDDVLVPAGKIRVFAGNEAEAAHQGIVTSEA